MSVCVSELSAGVVGRGGGAVGRSPPPNKVCPPYVNAPPQKQKKIILPPTTFWDRRMLLHVCVNKQQPYSKQACVYKHDKEVLISG